ncbi:DUF2062 domain-containing protein [Chitinimonas sp.]|uniref:DUF2062 domain-containing protein n=1 Tax=Chitinimonas sp. TaxID=1934313 RepID=UPI0035B3BD94
MRKHLHRWLPKQETLAGNRLLARFAPWLQAPALWQLNRRAIAGGAAIGLACAMIPGPLQLLGATLACCLFRVNLPVAALGTLVSNPLTIVPLYLLAYYLGSLLSGADPGSAHLPPPEFRWSELHASAEQWLGWLQAQGSALLIGLPVLALAMAGLAYALVHVGWRLYTVQRLRQRRRRAAAA